MLIARIIAIWFFGLVGSAILGFFIGTRLFNLDFEGQTQMMIAAMCLFACVRLWLTSSKGTL